MRVPQVFALVVIAASVCVVPMSAQEHEKKIKRSDLPPTVEKTVANQTQGATIRGFNEEKENGQTYYEAETTVSGHSKDILIDPTGAVVEVEEEIELSS